MKNIIKNLIKSIIFVIVFYVILYLVSYFFVPNKNLSTFSVKDIAKNEILAEDSNSIDVAFIGDSLVYCGISPMEIWNKYGYTCFDVANPAQLLSKACEDLEIACKSQELKIAFLEADVLFRNEKDKRLTPKIQDFVKDNMPLVPYHNVWKDKLFPSLPNNNIKVATEIYKGYRYSTKVAGSEVEDYMDVTNSKEEIPQDNFEYFEKIIELSKENNIKLVLFSIPSSHSWNYAKNISTIEIAKKYDIEYIDLNTENPLNIDWDKDTADKGEHLNYDGAVKVSEYFGKYLQDSKLVIDHRNDEAYNSWNRGYEMYTNLLE